MQPAEHIHPDLLAMCLVNRRTEEYVGACPFCGGDAGSDRPAPPSRPPPSICSTTGSG